MCFMIKCKYNLFYIKKINKIVIAVQKLIFLVELYVCKTVQALHEL